MAKQTTGELARNMANAPTDTPRKPTAETLPLPTFSRDARCKAFPRNKDGSLPSRLAHAHLDLGIVTVSGNIYASDREVTTAAGREVEREVTFSLPRGTALASEIDLSVYGARVLDAYDKWADSQGPQQAAQEQANEKPRLIKRFAVPAK